MTTAELRLECLKLAHYYGPVSGTDAKIKADLFFEYCTKDGNDTDVAAIDKEEGFKFRSPTSNLPGHRNPPPPPEKKPLTWSGKDILDCPNGLYRVYTISNESHLSAIGTTEAGNRWIVSANWGSSVLESIQLYLPDIIKVELIEKA